MITDLDGTAVPSFREDSDPQRGRTRSDASLRAGPAADLNSLRFPLSVIRTFGQDWYKLSNAPIPTVTCNGSLMGYVKKTDEGELAFEEAAAFPLTRGEIVEALEGATTAGRRDQKHPCLLLSARLAHRRSDLDTGAGEHHSGEGEVPQRSSVTAIEFQKLQDQMLAEDICMIFLLIDALKIS